MVSNLKVPKGEKKIGMERVGYYWHSDSSFMPDPLPLTMLHARVVPKDQGQTAFIDMNKVYQELPKTIQAMIDNRWAPHEGKWRYLVTEKDIGLSLQDLLDRDAALLPAPVHPLVVVHPVTKRKSLYITEGISKRILGIDSDASDSLMSALEHRAWNDDSQYKHQWEQGDLLIWDNRSLNHRAWAAAAGQDRLMYRIGLNDGAFFGKTDCEP